MCGRARASLQPQAFACIAGIEPEVVDTDYSPSYNLGPGATMPVLMASFPQEEAEQLGVRTMR